MCYGVEQPTRLVEKGYEIKKKVLIKKKKKKNNPLGWRKREKIHRQTHNRQMRVEAGPWSEKQERGAAISQTKVREKERGHEDTKIRRCEDDIESLTK